jgi:hypothetical protein
MLLPRVNWITRLGGPIRGLGPYAAIELLVPGGSLIVLSLLAFRHRAWFFAQARRRLAKFAALIPHNTPSNATPR